MGTRENKVETYFKENVKLIGGDTRKWVSPGRDGVPDQIVFYNGDVFFVEVKTSDGNFQPGQEREHTRLRELGANVSTVYGHVGVNQLIQELITFNRPLSKFYG